MAYWEPLDGILPAVWDFLVCLSSFCRTVGDSFILSFFFLFFFLFGFTLSMSVYLSYITVSPVSTIFSPLAMIK